MENTYEQRQKRRTEILDRLDIIYESYNTGKCILSPGNRVYLREVEKEAEKIINLREETDTPLGKRASKIEGKIADLLTKLK